MIWPTAPEDDEEEEADAEEPVLDGDVEDGCAEVDVADVPFKRSALRMKPSSVSVLLALKLMAPTPPMPQVL